MFRNCQRPVMCPPQYRIHDRYVKRPFPVIHPIVDVERVNVVNVPEHVYKPVRRRVINNPNQCCY